MPAPRSRPPLPATTLSTAWILLVLRDGETYGRALFGRLRDRGISIDESAAYRRLCALEADGALTSRATKSDAGPNRHAYQLTDEGRRVLGECAACVAAAWQQHEAFLRGDGRAPAAPPTTDDDGRAADQARARPRLLTPDEPVERGAGERAREPQQPADGVAVSVLGRELLTAWLLMLLFEDGPSYGYGLRRVLSGRQISVDYGTLYRLLRTLERDGWLRSHWTEATAGPERRLYDVTAEGLHHLGDLIVALTIARDRYAAFLHAYGGDGR